MEWTETAPPITILKHNITLPDYVLVDFTATSVRRVIFLCSKIRTLFIPVMEAPVCSSSDSVAAQLITVDGFLFWRRLGNKVRAV